MSVPTRSPLRLSALWSRATLPVRLGAVVAVVGVVLVAALAVRGDGPAHEKPGLALFAPSPGSVVPAASVRDEVVAAIRGLLAEPFVHIDGLGYSSGTRSDLTVDVDVARSAVRFRELISQVTAIGQPAGPDPIVSEYVLIGADQYLRILQPGQDPSTPFQVLDVAPTARDLVNGAYVDGGQIFDSLDVLARVVAEVPFAATRLEPRAPLGTEGRGVRAVFSTADVVRFLGSEGLEAVGSHEGDPGETSFELWYADRRLVELVATDQQLFDGEVIADVAVWLTYRTDDRAPITAPSNTVPAGPP